MADLTKRTYLKYSPDVSKVAEGEDKAITGIRGVFDRVLHLNYGKHGHTYPTTHATSLGVLKGKLIVSDDLPAHLKQGPFAKGGEYPVAIRLSVGSNEHNQNTIQFRGRGLGMKIFGWPGDRFPEGKGNASHDVTMNSQYTVSELADAKTAFDRISIVEKMLTDPAGGIEDLKKRPDAMLQLQPIIPGDRFRVEAMDFYSQFAYRFGDYIAKQGLFPVSDTQKELATQKLPADKGSIADLKGWLTEFYGSHEGVYEWRFQLCENIADQPVEYAGTPWDTTKYPYQTVAKLVFPKQNPCNEELISFWEDNMRINVWRGLSSLEPLGGANRVRRVLYPNSKVIRSGLNPSTLVDVQTIEELPGELPESVSACSIKHTESLASAASHWMASHLKWA